MDYHQIPQIWLTPELVPVPKDSDSKVKNDLRPIAQTAIIMKCFKSIVMKHLNPSKLIDKHQFACQNGCNVEDTKLSLLKHLQTYLDKTRMYTRILLDWWELIGNL